MRISVTAVFCRDGDGEYVIDRIPYSAILIIRLLLLKDKDPEAWRIFNHLEPLLQEWKDMGSWEADQGDIVNIIRERLGMKTFSREEILKVRNSLR